jgi:hypothetical protein
MLRIGEAVLVLMSALREKRVVGIEVNNKLYMYGGGY